MNEPQAISTIQDAAGLRAARETAYAEFKKTQSVGKLTKQLSKQSDQLLVHLWNSCSLNNEAALVAVGGYGRGALFPYSDIDILILLPANEEQARSLSKQVEQFIASCWDAGLEIGASVRNDPMPALRGSFAIGRGATWSTRPLLHDGAPTARGALNAG